MLLNETFYKVKYFLKTQFCTTIKFSLHNNIDIHYLKVYIIYTVCYMLVANAILF